MVSIANADLGFDLTFGGVATKADLEKWYEESEQVLRGQYGPFGVIVDIRTVFHCQPKPKG